MKDVSNISQSRLNLDVNTQGSPLNTPFPPQLRILDVPTMAKGSEVSSSAKLPKSAPKAKRQFRHFSDIRPAVVRKLFNNEFARLLPTATQEFLITATKQLWNILTIELKEGIAQLSADKFNRRFKLECCIYQEALASASVSHCACTLRPMLLLRMGIFHNVINTIQATQAVMSKKELETIVGIGIESIKESQIKPIPMQEQNHVEGQACRDESFVATFKSTLLNQHHNSQLSTISNDKNSEPARTQTNSRQGVAFATQARLSMSTHPGVRSILAQSLGGDIPCYSQENPTKSRGNVGRRSPTSPVGIDRLANECCDSRGESLTRNPQVKMQANAELQSEKESVHIEQVSIESVKEENSFTTLPTSTSMLGELYKHNLPPKEVETCFDRQADVLRPLLVAHGRPMTRMPLSSSQGAICSVPLEEDKEESYLLCDMGSPLKVKNLLKITGVTRCQMNGTPVPYNPQKAQTLFAKSDNYKRGERWSHLSAEERQTWISQAEVENEKRMKRAKQVALDSETVEKETELESVENRKRRKSGDTDSVMVAGQKSPVKRTKPSAKTLAATTLSFQGKNKRRYNGQDTGVNSLCCSGPPPAMTMTDTLQPPPGPRFGIQWEVRDDKGGLECISRQFNVFGSLKHFEELERLLAQTKRKLYPELMWTVNESIADFPGLEGYLEW